MRSSFEYPSIPYIHYSNISLLPYYAEMPAPSESSSPSISYFLSSCSFSSLSSSSIMVIFLIYWSRVIRYSSCCRFSISFKSSSSFLIYSYFCLLAATSSRNSAINLLSSVRSCSCASSINLSYFSSSSFCPLTILSSECRSSFCISCILNFSLSSEL